MRSTRTKVFVDQQLLREAMACAPVKTQEAVIHLALREFVQRRQVADIRDLRGKGLIDPAYNHRSARGEQIAI